MAKLLGVPAMPFDIMYPEKAIKFKRTVLDYIKVLRRAHQDISQGDVVDVVNGIE
jgi:hypothetical protein